MRYILCNIPASRRGFTIVELLIVVVVIAILVAITTVAYSGVSARANNSSLQSNISTTVKKLEIYKVNTGSFPTNLTDAGIEPNSNYIITYTASGDGSSYCTSSSKSGRIYYASNTTSNPATGKCSGPVGIPGTGNIASDGASITYDSIFGGQTPPGSYTVWNDGGGSLVIGNRFYTTTTAGIKVYGLKVWNPAGADTSFLALAITATAYLNSWTGTNINGTNTFSTPVATKTYSTARSAGSWTEIIFDSPITLAPISSAAGPSDLLTLAILYNGGNHYVFATPTPNNGSPVQSTAIPGTYLAENNNIGRGINTADSNGFFASYYGIDLIFGPN